MICCRFHKIHTQYNKPVKLSLRVSANVSESPKFARHAAALHNPLNVHYG
jgi:hypothetical protein